MIKLCYVLTRTLDDVGQVPTILGCLDSTFNDFACRFQNDMQVCDLDMVVNTLSCYSLELDWKGYLLRL